MKTCERCGWEGSVRKMKAHVGSATCIARRKTREMEERGLVLVPRFTILRACGLDHLIVPAQTGLVKEDDHPNGGKVERDQATLSVRYWAPAWAGILERRSVWAKDPHAETADRMLARDSAPYVKEQAQDRLKRAEAEKALRFRLLRKAYADEEFRGMCVAICQLNPAVDALAPVLTSLEHETDPFVLSTAPVFVAQTTLALSASDGTETTA